MTKVKNIILFITFQIIFLAVGFPLLLFYGPFSHSKSIVIGMTSNSTNYRFVPELFYSKNFLQKFAGSPEENVVESTKSDESMIVIPEECSVRVELEELGGDYSGKCITVYDPKRVCVIVSKYVPLRGETTSALARSCDAIAAINGQGFDGTTNIADGTGGVISGYVISREKIYQGDNYDSSIPQAVAAMTKSGKMIVGNISLDEIKERNENCSEDDKVIDAMTFGPVLVKDGINAVSDYIEQKWAIDQRVAIGQKKTGEIVMITVDGRRTTHPGISLRNLANMLLQKGVVNAINLDGGSSSTMVYKNRVVNELNSPMGERCVPAIFAVLKKH